MNSIIKKAVAAVVTVSLCSFGMTKASENENGVKFAVQGDLVSSYIWRGMYQTGASFQPALAFSVAGFSLTAWGSTDFDGYRSSEGLANKEIDLTAAYTFGASGLTLSIADLWWAGQGANKYFNFKSHETAHHFEAGLAYTLPLEKFPLSLAWYTMFAGQDKDADGNQNYSSYSHAFPVDSITVSYYDDAEQHQLLFTVYSDGVCIVNSAFVTVKYPGGGAEELYQELREIAE